MVEMLNLIKEAAKESNAFENHAAKDLPLEDRLLYLQGLALVMNADGEIHREEKDYLLILIKSFDLDESLLESCIDFANQPDKSTIQSVLKCFKRKPIAQLFLFDALMISYRDGDISEQEKEVIDELAFQFEVAKGIYQDIFDLFCYIKNRNWQDAALYFSIHLLNPDYFNHIFSYYDVSLEQVSKQSKKESKKKILSCIKNKLENGISNEVILPFLQVKIDKKEASVINGNFILPDLDEFKLSTININYDKLSETLHIDSSLLIKQNPIVNYFIKSIGLTDSDRYKLDGGTQKIIISKLGKNNRVLDLGLKFEEGCLIDVNGTLWSYKKGRGDNCIIGKSIIFSNTKKNFKQLENVKGLPLHSSLTDTSNAGWLTKFYE
ncbi:TPA: TerB family tellurite resistance protein [Vibrio parahaemolyticus]|nr:TerB family tellurite resistance protein [Vibrio parahaemolyticus]HCG6302127.1 TerB family tellurite resistance protein [Vibrio parahaemolyticus]HCG6996211.1 TerB family tellurite resistance protein [Vibrio parahaemolyticus]HCG7009249.1 TerB family tellurite resistance protein [Vibrio parahaemolyticus]HCG7012040.1 TerB family tellurite resistance protein [Vibrio parahaemolyticus]